MRMHADVEHSPDALASLAQFYGIRRAIRREPFLQISEDQEGEVSSVALALLGVQGPLPQLAASVGELIGPLPRDFVQRWVERGFIVETQWSPVGHQGGTIAMFAPGYDARPRATVRERILQRFTIHTTTKGDKPTAVFLHTYSWPPLGMPGMNIEKIEWTRQAGAKRVFGNEPLERTGSIPYADR